jgi:hypothetical protein
MIQRVRECIMKKLVQIGLSIIDSSIKAKIFVQRRRGLFSHTSKTNKRVIFIKTDC